MRSLISWIGVFLFSISTIIFACMPVHADEVLLNSLAPIEKQGGFNYEFKEAVKTVYLDGVEYPSSYAFVGSVTFNLGKKYSRFVAVAGVDDNKPLACNLSIYANNRLVYSGNFQNGDKPDNIEIDVSDVTRFTMEAADNDASGLSLNLKQGCYLGSPRLVQTGSGANGSGGISSGGECPTIMPSYAEELSTDLSAAADVEYDGKKLTVVVAPFKSIGLTETCSKSISQYVKEDVTNALINTSNFIGAERERLEEILKELDLQYSDTIDEETARKIGRHVGADAVLIGSISQRSPGNLVIQARLVDVEKGTSNVAATAVVKAESKPLPTSVINISPPPQPEQEQEPQETPQDQSVWECTLDKLDGSTRHYCRGCGTTRDEARNEAVRTCQKTNNPNCEQWSYDSSHTSCVQKSEENLQCKIFSCSSY